MAVVEHQAVTTRFEYRIVRRGLGRARRSEWFVEGDESRTYALLGEVLNEMGRDGWQVAGVHGDKVIVMRQHTR